MTKNLTIFSALIASLIYVGAVVGLIVLGARFLEEGLVDLPKEWTAVLILILFTVVFCSFLISNALKNNLEKRNQSVILDRLGVYKRLLDLWIGDQFISSQEKAPYQLSYAMSLLASDNVLKQYKKLVQFQETDPQDIGQKRKMLQRIILEMRRDLGQLNFAILQGDLDFVFNIENSKQPSYETEKTYSTT
jgi:hypothetical protein